MHPDEYQNMMDDFDAQFDRQLELDNWIGAKQSAYEERIVKVILNEFELGAHISRYKRQLKEISDTDVLSFIWFRNAFPDFPLFLGASSNVFSRELALSDLYKRFSRTKMFETFEALVHEVAQESDLPVKDCGACGLIFPWAKIGNVVLHNLSIELEGTRLTRTVKTGLNSEFRTLYLDTLTPLLAALKGTWIPTVYI